MFTMARTKAGIAIQSRITERDLTQGKLARALKRSQTWVSQSLLDDTEKTLRRIWVRDPETLEVLLKELAWDNEQLASETGLNFGAPYPTPNVYTDQVHLETHDINQGWRQIPVIDLLSAGPGGDGGTAVETIDLGPRFVGPHAAYRVTGDSMFPEVHDGGTVVIKCQEYSSPGNIIVCWTPDDGMLCKLLDRTEDGYYVLTSLNPAYKPIWTKEIHIYGVMVEARNPRKVINGNH